MSSGIGRANDEALRPALALFRLLHTQGEVRGMAGLGLLAFGAVVGWWAVSLVGWRRPSLRAVAGAAAGIATAGLVVAMLTRPGELVGFACAGAVAACAHSAFLGVLARIGSGPRKEQL